MDNDIKTRAKQIIKSWQISSSYKKKQLLEFLGIPVIICDKTGTVLDYNTQAYLILGLSHEELENQNLKELLETKRLKNNSHSSVNNVYSFNDRNNNPHIFFINSYLCDNYDMYILVRADGYINPEEALLVTEQRYRNLVENAVEGIFILGINGFYLVNEEFCNMLGYSMVDILKIDPYELIPEYEREKIRQYLMRKLEGQILMHRKVEQVLLSKNGEQVICEMRYFSTMYNGDYAIQGHVRDLSFLKRVEKELEESEEVYRIVVENAYDNVWIFSSDGVVYANKKLCDTVGYNRDEIIGNKEFEWIAPEYRQRFIKILSGKHIFKKLVYFHCDLITSKGIRKAFEVTISPIFIKNKPAYIAIGKDISKKREQERQKRMEKRKDRIVNRILRIIAESKDNENAFLDVIKFLGKEFPQRGFELYINESENTVKVYRLVNDISEVSFIVQENNKQLFTNLENRRSEYRSIFKVCNNRPEDDYFCTHGFKYLMQLNLTGLNKPFGIFRCAWQGEESAYENRIINEIILDIAIALESSLYREKITRITKEAAEKEKNKLLSKFSLIGEMSTSIAHEVRNPMTTVRGLAQLLAEENPAQRVYYEMMIEEIDRANTTITEFLNLARNKFSRKEKTELVSLLEIVVELMRGEAAIRGVNLITDFSSQQIIVYVDKEQIKQAFINIVKNALEASQMGNTVSIKTECNQKMINIEFQDEGIGVDPKHINHIMEPFFTTKDNNAGLGLSVSYKIIRDHGGDMIISSVLNKGTLVNVSLPILEQDN